MSAFLCTERHIGLLARWYTEREQYGARSTAEEVAEVLARENLLSLDARYGEGEGDVDAACLEWAGTAPAENFYRACAEYAAQRLPRLDDIPRGWVAKMLDCYEYQTCEHAGWHDQPDHTNRAKIICNRIRRILTNGLEGYEDGPWGYDEEYEAKLTAAYTARELASSNHGPKPVRLI